MGAEDVCHEILCERARQDAKWGDQSHLPDACPVLLGRVRVDHQRLAEDMDAECDYVQELVDAAAYAWQRYLETRAYRWLRRVRLLDQLICEVVDS